MNRTGRKRQPSNITGKESRKGRTAKIDFATPVADDEDDYKDRFYGRKDKTSKRINKSRDEVIYSDDDSVESQLDEREYSNVDDLEMGYSSSDESKRETVDEKRLRLAREYLQKVEQATKDNDGSSSNLSSSDDDVSEKDNHLRDKVSKRLSRERLKQQGRLDIHIATSIQHRINDIWMHLGTESIESIRDQAESWIEGNFITAMKGHDLTPTCVALHMPTGDVAYSGSKDGSVLMWDIEKECRLNTIIPHWKKNPTNPDRKHCEVLAIACSDDGRYLAVGGRDNKVKIYDIRLAGKDVQDSLDANQHHNNACGLISTFDGHKGSVTTLTFRSQSSQLFSGSDDRCIRHFDLSEMSYVETLYGHQAGVTGIACCTRDMPFSVGRDRTARAWKLNEETHLIFRGGSKTTSADCITAVNDEFFLTGHDDGALSLWCKDKKKPFATVTSSHGQSASGIPRGIICCSSLGYSDVAVTGSNDGYVRYWKVNTDSVSDEPGLHQLSRIPIFGYVNSLAIGPRGRFAIAAVGQEPKLGRWDRVPNSKNRIVVIRHSEGQL